MSPWNYMYVKHTKSQSYKMSVNSHKTYAFLNKIQKLM